MDREELKPARFTFDIAGDTSRSSYTGVQKGVTATGAQYTVYGPLARAIQAMLEAQRQSWLRGMKPCEHGKIDFEQCPQCWPENRSKL
jgi:hypothetical protein